MFYSEMFKSAKVCVTWSHMESFWGIETLSEAAECWTFVCWSGSFHVSSVQTSSSNIKVGLFSTFIGGSPVCVWALYVWCVWYFLLSWHRYVKCLHIVHLSALQLYEQRPLVVFSPLVLNQACLLSRRRCCLNSWWCLMVLSELCCTLKGSVVKNLILFQLVFRYNSNLGCAENNKNSFMPLSARNFRLCYALYSDGSHSNK